MRVPIIIASWLLGITAFILAAATGAFVAPGFMIIAGMFIRIVWVRGFSIYPIASFLPLCGMWWSAQKQFTTPSGLEAARIGCVALFAFLVIYGIFSDIRKIKAVRDRGDVA